jgi:hypothetical protein
MPSGTDTQKSAYDLSTLDSLLGGKTDATGAPGASPKKSAKSPHSLSTLDSMLAPPAPQTKAQSDADITNATALSSPFGQQQPSAPISLDLGAAPRSTAEGLVTEQAERKQGAPLKILNKRPFALMPAQETVAPVSPETARLSSAAQPAAPQEAPDITLGPVGHTAQNPDALSAYQQTFTPQLEKGIQELPEHTKAGIADILESGYKAAEPALAASFGAIPLKTLVGLGLAAGMSKGGGAVAKALGGDPDTQRLVEAAAPLALGALEPLIPKGSKLPTLDNLTTAQRVALKDLTGALRERATKLGVPVDDAKLAEIQQNALRQVKTTKNVAKDWYDTAEALRAGHMDQLIHDNFGHPAPVAQNPLRAGRESENAQNPFRRSAKPDQIAQPEDAGDVISSAVGANEGAKSAEQSAAAAEQQPKVVDNRAVQPQPGDLRGPVVRSESNEELEAKAQKFFPEETTEIQRQRAEKAFNEAPRPEHIVGYNASDGKPIIDVDKVKADIESRRNARFARNDEQPSSEAGVARPDVFSSVAKEALGEDARRAAELGGGRIGNDDVKRGADAYNAEHGRPPIDTSRYIETDPRAKEIADAYEQALHNPKDEATARSYGVLKDEIRQQWDHATRKMGITFEPWEKEGQPYKNSAEMMADVKNNKHLYFFRGGEMPADHPLGAVDSHTGLTFNDEFRAIHDLYGHAAAGNQFGPRGEENAFLAHSQMFSPEALPAVFSETKAQNSFVNFGRHLRNEAGEIPGKGEPGYVPPTERRYADQKATTLPSKYFSRPEEMVDVRHKSPRSDIRSLNPEFQHTNESINPGAEKQRMEATPGVAPRRVYAQQEGTPLERKYDKLKYEYKGKVPAADLYDISRDPNGLRAKAQAAASKDGISGKGVASYLEREIKRAGYKGYRTADGTIAYYDRLKVEPNFIPDSLKARLKPNELAELNTTTKQMNFLQARKEIGPIGQMLEAIKSGRAAMKWYQVAETTYDSLAEGRPELFPQDVDHKQKFVDLMAALSPVQPVDEDFNMAVKYFTRWMQSGEKTDPKSLDTLFSDLGLKGSRGPNARRALLGENLSGYKVSNFSGNLMGEPYGVTLDSWMGVFFRQDPGKLMGDPSYYYAASAAVREAADHLGIQPREAQAAIWTFVKTLTEVSGTDARGSKLPMPEVVEMLDDQTMKDHAADLASILLYRQKTRDLLAEKGFDLEKLDEAVRRRASEAHAEAREIGSPDRRVLAGLAKQIEKFITSSRKAKDTVERKSEPDLFTDDTSFSPEAGVTRPDVFTSVAKKVLTDKEARRAAATAGALLEEKQPAAEPVAKTGRYAGSVNLDRLNISDEGKQVVRDVFDQNKDLINKQRRGTISLEDTKKAAEDIGFDADQIARVKRGKALNAEQITAARTVLASTADKVTETRKAYQSSKSDADMMAFQEAVAKHVLVQRAVSGASSEAGRALNAMKIYAEARKLTEAGKTSKALDLLQKNLGDKWKDKADAITKDLAAIPDGDHAAMNKFLRNYTQFKTVDKIHAYWVANVLSGTSTLERKFISDQIVGALQFPERVASGLIDIPLSKLMGKPRSVYAREALPATMAWFRGIPEGLRRAAYVMRNGMTEDQAARAELPRYEPFGPWKIPGRLISAATDFSQHLLFSSELTARATRQAIQEGLKGHALQKRVGDLVSAPTPDMVDAATAYSKWGTFVAPNKVAQGLARLRESTKPFGPYIVPFVEIPSNILTVAGEHSPLGLLRLPKASPEARAEILGKAAVGSLMMLGMLPLAASGKITGGGPEDRNEKDALLRQGWQPYSIKLGNRWVPYKSLGFIGPMLATVASVHDAYAEKGNVPTMDKAVQAAANLGNFYTEESFFRGIEDMMNAIREPGRYASKWLADVAGGFVPFSGLDRQITNATDNTVRATDSVPDRIKSALPFFSKSLPARPDVFGRTEKKRGAEGALAFLPGRVPEDKPVSPVDAELNRLGIFPGQVGKSFSLGNQHATLTPEQQRAYQTISGKMALRGIKNVMASEEYKSLSDEQKSQMLNYVISKARQISRPMFLGWLKQNGQKLGASSKSVPEQLGVPIPKTPRR